MRKTKVREGYFSEKLRDISYIQELPKLGNMQQRVYEVIKEHGPISTEEIAIELGVYPHTITPRVKELREMGLVEFYDIGQSHRSGKAVSLWKAVPLGKNQAEQLNLFFDLKGGNDGNKQRDDKKNPLDKTPGWYE